jgi:hypothetical protein
MAWPRIRAMDCSQRPIFKAFVIAGGPKVPNSAKNWTVMGVKLRCISDVSNADHVRSSPDSRHFQSQSACLKGAKPGLVRPSKLSDYPISSSASESGSAEVAIHYAIAACD